MTRSRKLTRESLIAFGTERLADILIEEAARNKALKQALMVALAEIEGPHALAAEVRKRIGSLERSSAFVYGRQVRPLVADLDRVRRMITDKVAPTDADLGLELIWRFLDLADAVFERCDDSSGLVGEVFRLAVGDLGPIAVQSSSRPEALADQVAVRLQNNGYGIYDEVIASVFPALGEAGVARLKAHLDVWSQALDDHGSKRTSLGRFGILNARQALADAEGDVDAFIAGHDLELLRNPMFAARIAERLVAAGRPADAITHLDQAKPNVWFGLREWHDARITAAVATGDPEQAQALRWRMFETVLEPGYLRDFLNDLPDFEDVEAEKRALDQVEAHPDIHLALAFLLEWPALDRATRMILLRNEEVDGDLYELLNPAADRLAEKHPLASAILRRALVEHTLDRAKSTRYKHAVRHVEELEALDTRVENYEGHEDHAAFMGRLKSSHPRKSGFWGQLSPTKPRAR